MTTEPTTTDAVDISVLLPVADGHALITGPTNSGKTHTLAVVWQIEHADPTIASWVCDPTGSVAPDIAARLEHYAAGHQASLDLLTEASAEIDLRTAARQDRSPFQPTDQVPLIAVSVDDAHLLFEDPHAVDLAVEIAVLGREVGVLLRVASTSGRLSALRSARLASQLRNRRPLLLKRRLA